MSDVHVARVGRKSSIGDNLEVGRVGGDELFGRPAVQHGAIGLDNVGVSQPVLAEEDGGDGKSNNDAECDSNTNHPISLRLSHKIVSDVHPKL